MCSNMFFDMLGISVKKKGSTLSDIIEVGDGANSVEEIDIEENQPIHTGLPLLANEEFEKETGGYQSEAEEDEEEHPEEIMPVENSSDAKAASKKRKASKKLKSSKYVLQLISYRIVIYMVMPYQGL